MGYHRFISMIFLDFLFGQDRTGREIIKQLQERCFNLNVVASVWENCLSVKTALLLRPDVPFQIPKSK